MAATPEQTQAEGTQPVEALPPAPGVVPPTPDSTLSGGSACPPLPPQELVDGTEDEGTMLCSTCRRPTDSQNSIIVVRATDKRKQANRCKSCHSSKAAIARLQKRHGSLVQEFNGLDAGSMEGFFRDHGHLRGEDLKVALQSTVEDYSSAKTYMAFEGTGEYYDKEDMAKRYEDKPDQLAIDHMRGVWLYEDCKYVRKIRDEEERGTSTRRKAKTPLQGNVDEDGPSGSMPASEGRKKPRKDEPSHPKIKAGQLKKLTKKAEQLKEKKLTLLDLLSQAKQLAEMVPPYVCQAAENSIAAATKVAISLQSMIDAGHGNFEDASNQVETMLSDMADNVSRVSIQIEHASAYKKHT